MNLPAIISFGISIISIIITITVIVLIFLRKLKQKTEQQNDKISIFWTIPFIILILLSIGLIGTTIGMNEMKDDNMDNTVTEIKSIIDSARQRLNAVTLENFNRPIPLHRRDFMRKLEVDCKFELMRKYYLAEMETAYEDADPFEKWIMNLNKTNTCAIKQGLYTLDLMIVKYVDLIHEANVFYDNEVKPIYKEMDRTFYKHFEIEEKILFKKSYGKWKVKKGVELRKKILDNFEADMNNVQIVRRKWVEKMAEKLSAKKMLIKKCIIISCSILIVLSIISILFIVLGSKRIPLSSICKPTLFLIAGVCSILTSIVVIVVSLDIFEKCSLNDNNFGLQDFISPIPGNESLSICQSPDSSFYSDLGNDTLVTFEDVERDLELPQHRDMYRSEIINNMHKLTIHQNYIDTNKSVEVTHGKMTNACKNNCFPNDAGKLCKYTNVIKNALLIPKKIESMAIRFNTFFESPERNQIIDNVINWHYANMFTTMSLRHINPTQEKVIAADFSCDPLIEKFTQTGRSICDQLDIPIPILHICLTIVAVSICAYMVLNVLMFKYSFNGKDNNKLDSGNKPSQSPAMSPTNV